MQKPFETGMKIAVLGCKGTTIDLIHNIRLRGELSISCVITLGGIKASANKVAHYEGNAIKEYCLKHEINTYEVENYDLKSEKDRNFFSSENFDLLLVIGWERLLPKSILETLNIFACGMHGSAYGLPKGRGRSPMNWALLTGHKKFITYLFRYSAGMDDGDLIGFKVFDISVYDDIASLHTKNRIAMGELIHLYAPKIMDKSLRLFSQPDTNPTYYPKRTREDGFIDWAQPSEAIHQLVRAVAPPYPGAISVIDGKEFSIFNGQPFDSGLYDASIEPGTIVDINLSLKRLVVKTSDGTYLITNLDLDLSLLDLGQKLESISFDEQLKKIRERYPDWVSIGQQEI